MKYKFHKYQGTGNDFILIDGMSPDFKFSLETRAIAQLCNRRFGIGADGLIVLNPSHIADFKMVYYNSDGGLSSMCGNGSRCALRFASNKGYLKKYVKFEAADGLHKAKVKETISVKMINVSDVEEINDDFYLNTGSPHYVRFVTKLDDLDIIAEARKIRYNDRFKTQGTNVNFVKIVPDGIKVRTYERGVEDETFSCGTGVVASAIARHLQDDKSGTKFNIETKGGKLGVSFKSDFNVYRDIWLSGPAQEVYIGQFNMDNYNG